MPKIVDHDKRKELIADATIRVVKHVGLEKTTVRKIAEEAGLSMGSVQYYFPAQHDLYIFAMELILQRTEDRIKSAVVEGTSIEEGVATILKQLVPHDDADIMIECEVWLTFSLMAVRDPSLKSLSHHIYKIERELMVNMLTVLRDNKVLVDSFDIENEAVLLHAFIDGITVQAVLFPHAFDEVVIKKCIMDYLQSLQRGSRK